VNVSRVSFSVHCGSHADAPLHYDARSATAGHMPLEPFLGACRVIDARGPGPLCLPNEIEADLDGAPPSILLRLSEGHGPKNGPRASGRSTLP
jgi:arylformamidase